MLKTSSLCLPEKNTIVGIVIAGDEPVAIGGPGQGEHLVFEGVAGEVADGDCTLSNIPDQDMPILGAPGEGATLTLIFIGQAGKHGIGRDLRERAGLLRPIPENQRRCVLLRDIAARNSAIVGNKGASRWSNLVILERIERAASVPLSLVCSALRSAEPGGFITLELDRPTSMPCVTAKVRIVSPLGARWL